MKKHIASILFLFLLSTFQLIAQSHSVKRLGIEQGLSNNYVVSITQDKQGFLCYTGGCKICGGMVCHRRRT